MGGRSLPRRLGKPQRHARRRRFAGIAAVVLAALALVVTHAPALHLLGSEPIRLFPAAIERRPAPVAAVFLSGDMGFRFGMSGDVAAALAQRGVPVVGIVSPVAFAQHRTRAQATAVVEQALRLALQSTGARHLVLVGESFGADVVATVAPDLPPDLLARIDAIDLTVPARDVYFRSDPSGLAYVGQPDAYPERALVAMHGPHVVCIYGVEEPDSLCPRLARAGAKVIGLPGGHYMDHNPARLIATTLDALHLAGSGRRVR
jgi:type IV secretory pathway VirJ component